MRDNPKTKDKPFKWGKWRYRCDICGIKDYEENLIEKWWYNEEDWFYLHESCVIDVISNAYRWRRKSDILAMCIDIVEKWKERGKHINELVDKANKLCKGE